MRPRFGDTDIENKAAFRHYTQTNREVWKSLGFTLINTRVHELDKELVLAEIAVRRQLQLVRMAEDKETPMLTLRNISLRNMESRIDKAERAKLLEEAANSEAKKDIALALEKSAHYIKKHTGVQNNYDAEAPFEQRTRLEAKGVSYNNAAVAYHRYAQALLDHAAQTSVFGVGEESA